MRLITVVPTLILIFGIASATDNLMFARLTAFITCNGQPWDANVEIMAAGDYETDHDHLAIVVPQNGKFDSVISRTNNPIYFLRVHSKCSKCPPIDSTFVRSNQQHWNWLTAVNNPVNLGIFETGRC
uniref:Transthyretin-like family protein n=1 Tax=Panagrellus redivivus TaxID=6233 RepID=A0A7E4ZW62_PANRE